METKKCRKCHQEKFLSEYAKTRRVCNACRAASDKQYHAERWKKNLEGNRRQAREKMRARRLDPTNKSIELLNKRRYYKQDREKNLAYALKRQAERQEFLNEIKNVPCKDCGNSYPPYCMDFDHVDGDKSGNLSEMKSYSLERILAEIAKCEIVCANCHRIRTFNRNNGQPEPLIR